MKTIILSMSMLTLSCSAVVGLPEGDGHGGATPSPAPPPADSAEVKQDVPPASRGEVDACRACSGDWGVHGLSDTESCNCGTSDGGKRCTDGTDCQGVCFADFDKPEYEEVDPGPPARGFLVGRCSDFVTVFGCFILVDRGVRARGPISYDEPLPRICVDW